MSASGVQQYPGFKEEICDSGLVKINFAVGPDNGPPLVLLHGLGRRWQVFDPLIPALSKNWHIYAPDLRGHGKSTHVPGGYRGRHYAQDIVTFLEKHVPAPAIIFGHSLGGMIALWVAAHYPSRVGGLILGDSMLLAKSFEAGTMYPMLFAGLRNLA